MEHEHLHGLTQGKAAVVLVGAALATIGFYFLVFGFGIGFSSALFVMLLVIGLHAVAMASRKRGNAWAYVFLLPLFLSLVTASVCASPVARLFSLCVSVVSLLCLSYWLTSPRMPFRELPSLWPWALFIESLFPFRGFSKLWSPFLSLKGKGWSRVVVGMLISLPFLFIFAALFISSDEFIRKTYTDFFLYTDLEEIIARLGVHGIIFLFLSCFAWTVLSRLLEERKPVFRIVHKQFERITAATFLTLLNVLFLVFIGFQIIYFFGGEAFIQQQGLSYASYAREGFFQLLMVSVLVSLIIAVLYRTHSLHDRVIRWLGAGLIIETGVVIASAMRRMVLYIDAYGLTLSRYWAVAGITFIGIGLVITLCMIFANVSFSQWSKYLFIGSLTALALVNVLDTEGMIARYNVDRYLNGSSSRIDVNYLVSLSSDAVPQLVRLAQSHKTVVNSVDDNISEEWRQESFKQVLDNERTLLRETLSDWRNVVLSDYRAFVALALPSPSTRE